MGRYESVTWGCLWILRNVAFRRSLSLILENRIYKRVEYSRAALHILRPGHRR